MSNKFPPSYSYFMANWSHVSSSNIALAWAPEGRRKRGRPRTTWRRTVEKERTECGWTTWAEARNAAADRDGWRSAVEALCATKVRSS